MSRDELVQVQTKKIVEYRMSTSESDFSCAAPTVRGNAN